MAKTKTARKKAEGAPLNIKKASAVTVEAATLRNARSKKAVFDIDFSGGEWIDNPNTGKPYKAGDKARWIELEDGSRTIIPVNIYPEDLLPKMD